MLKTNVNETIRFGEKGQFLKDTSVVLLSSANISIYKSKNNFLRKMLYLIIYFCSLEHTHLNSFLNNCRSGDRRSITCCEQSTTFSV